MINQLWQKIVNHHNSGKCIKTYQKNKDIYIFTFFAFLIVLICFQSIYINRKIEVLLKNEITLTAKGYHQLCLKIQEHELKLNGDRHINCDQYLIKNLKDNYYDEK